MTTGHADHRNQFDKETLMEMSATHDTPLLTALKRRAPHNHLCSIYESPEEYFAVAIPFIRIGLDRGEKCIYIADEGTEAAVSDAMYGDGIDVERAIATDSLVMETKEAAYLKHGSFDPEWMFTFWADATAEAMSQGFSALRATGETEWVLRGAPGLERWIEYESRLMHTLARHKCFALCQSNRQLLPPELILDISAGVGIASMCERVEQLGGSLEITSGAGGTTVHAQLPLGKDAA